MTARRLVFAGLIACLIAGVVGVARPAGGAESTSGPLYGTVATGLRSAALTRLDTATLRPIGGRRLPIGQMQVTLRSPDGRSLLLQRYPSRRLRVVDLPTLTFRRTMTLPGSGWRVNPLTTGWLTADRVVLLQQRNRGAYHQIVAARRVVVVDPLAGRVVATRPFAEVRALRDAQPAGDRIVLLLGGQRGHSGRVGLAVVDSDGRTRSTDVVLGPVKGRFSPTLTIDPTGEHALLIQAGSPIADVDLATLAETRHEVSGADRVFAGSASWASRTAAWLDDTTVAIAGSNASDQHGFETDDPAGLAFLDTTTWQARMIDGAATRVQAAGDRVLVDGTRLGVVRRHQGQVGIGLRAYDDGGGLLWQRYAGKPVYAGPVRDLVIAQMLAARPYPPAKPGELLSLADGSSLGPAPARTYPLPDPPGVPRHMAAASAGDPALQVSGDGSSFTAQLREDVTRVVATDVDGRDEELEPNDGTLALTAQTPDDTVRELRAYAGDELLSDVTLAATCGGQLGPCAATVATPKPVPEYAFYNELPRGATTLVRIDPRTLLPVGKRLLLRPGFEPSYARSPDGQYVAIADRDRAALRIIDLSRMEVVKALPLGGTTTDTRAVAWLAADRIAVLTQRLSEPTRRYVRERTIVFADPQTARVVARREISPKLAIHGFASGGGRLVILLRSSEGKGTTDRLVAAGADTRVRSRLIEVGRRPGGALRYSALAMVPSGRRAFVVRPGVDEPTPPVVAVDLGSMQATEHRLRIGVVQDGRTPAFLAGGSVSAIDDHELLAGGVVSTGTRLGGHIFPAPGLFSIDTDSWAATQIDPRATYFTARGDRIVTFGPTGQPPSAHDGVGVTVYDDAGTELGHLYDGRTFAFGRVALAGNYGHVLTSPPRAKRLVFDLRSGRAVGTLPHLGRSPVLLDPPPQPAPARRMQAVAINPRTGAVLHVQPRAFGRPARAGDRIPNWPAASHIGGATDSRRIASATRGRLRANLYVVKTSKGMTCIALVARGIGVGCDPSPLFAHGRRVVGGEGSQFLHGVAADEVTRVVVDRYRGPRVRVPLSADNGFLFDCHPYDHHNGCACVVEWVDAYAGDTRVVHHRWLAPVCPYKRR